MKLKFTKMQGLGNDFVVFNGVEQMIALGSQQVRSIADRRFGVGCDQVLVLEAPQSANTDFRFRIFNSDGGEVEQCGNGARCVARFAHDVGLTSKEELRLESLGGTISARLEADGQVTVNMGVPRFEPAEVPFKAERKQSTYVLRVGDETREFSVLSMGNPHAVQRVDDVEKAPAAEEGSLIERHSAFPNGVNAGFLQVLDRSHAKVRVFERGVGETLSCGTGACAAAVAGIALRLLDGAVTMHTRGGNLHIRWAGEGQPVWMSGPAETTFTGEIEI
ncbi:MAG: diaminopimelate epimerase [Burkholderiales bacterium]